MGGASSAAVVREMVMKMGAVKNAEHGIDLADHIALGELKQRDQLQIPSAASTSYRQHNPPTQF